MVEEAENERHPLLERLRFISISASNLDEFISVRIAGLIGQAKAGVSVLSADGGTPAQQLAQIQPQAAALMHKQQQVWRDLRIQLDAAGITLCDASSPCPAMSSPGSTVGSWSGCSPCSRRSRSTRRIRFRSSPTWAW